MEKEIVKTVESIVSETVENETKNVTENTPPEQPTEDVLSEEDELRKPCGLYDFRLQGEKRASLLKEVKLDALKLKKELIETRFNSLSLKQLGINKKMFALRHSNDVRIFINAAISGRAGGAIVEQIEECVPETKYIALRPQQIRLVFTNEVGEGKETILEGIAAAEAEKQIQREEGILILDIGKECPRWDKMTESSQARFVNDYIQEISKYVDELPQSEEQVEYIKKKEMVKAELKAARKTHGKAERARAREIEKNVEKIRKENKTSAPWEE